MALGAITPMRGHSVPVVIPQVVDQVSGHAIFGSCHGSVSIPYVPNAGSWPCEAVGGKRGGGDCW